MNKEFIPYEQAKELKELGFDERCFGYYVGKELITSIDDIWDTNETSIIPAPTFSQAFRWFREKHNILFAIIPSLSDLGTYYKLLFFYSGDFRSVPARGKLCPTYEEAEIACIIKLIEMVKDKKQKTNNIGTMEIGRAHV